MYVNPTALFVTAAFAALMVGALNGSTAGLVAILAIETLVYMGCFRRT